MANAGVMTGADSLLFIDVLLMYCLMGISGSTAKYSQLAVV